jgi:hypothetical protein
MTKPVTPIQVHPQKCYDCGRELQEGEQAIASMDLPLAFCVACRGKSEINHPRLCKAVVKGESS